MSKNNKVNLFIVGAAKSATTSIYYYLSNHPEVFFPKLKEPRFFSSKYYSFPHKGNKDIEFTDRFIIRTLQDYENLYIGHKGEKIIGDASVDYLYIYQTAKDIHEYNPQSKIIIILRDPVQRAFSQYSHFVRDNRELETFEKALKLEEERIAMGYEFGWHYRKVGLYFEQVNEFIKTFEREKILILFFDDIEKDTRQTLEKICQFLDLDFSLIQNVKLMKHNTSGKSKSKLLNKLLFKHFGLKNFIKKIFPYGKLVYLKTLLNSLNTDKSFSNQELAISQLKKYFHEDIIKLEKLLNKDLSGWR